ncbi:MAG: HigA family addiction module antitoxin [Marinobacter sp.]
MRNIDAVTPGELLKEEFLEPMGISQYRLAKEIGVPAQRVGQIIAGKRSITADTDLRLCRFFALSNGYWLRAQAAYDIEITEDALADQLKNIRPWSAGSTIPKALVYQAYERVWANRSRQLVWGMISPANVSLPTNR